MSRSDLFRVYDMLVPRPRQLLRDPHAILLRHGPLRYYDPIDRRNKMRYVYLFSHCLILTKRWSEHRFRIKIYVHLHPSLRLFDGPMQDYFEFRVAASHGRHIIFFGRSRESTDGWLQAIHGALVALGTPFPIFSVGSNLSMHTLLFDGEPVFVPPKDLSTDDLEVPPSEPWLPPNPPVVAIDRGRKLVRSMSMSDTDSSSDVADYFAKSQPSKRSPSSKRSTSTARAQDAAPAPSSAPKPSARRRGAAAAVAASPLLPQPPQSRRDPAVAPSSSGAVQTFSPSVRSPRDHAKASSTAPAAAASTPTAAGTRPAASPASAPSGKTKAHRTKRSETMGPRSPLALQRADSDDLVGPYNSHSVLSPDLVKSVSRAPGAKRAGRVGPADPPKRSEAGAQQK